MCFMPIGNKIAKVLWRDIEAFSFIHAGIEKAVSIT